MAFSDFKFAEDDARIIADRLKDLYEAVRRANGEPGYRLALAEPERLIQLTEAAILAQVNHDIDATGKSNLLYFAGADTIEHIGYLYGERGKRLSSSFALTTLRYTLTIERTVITVIPKGYRVTPDNKVFFATMRTLEIPAGELYSDVEAICLTPGIEGDGWKKGEIKNIVDLLPFIASVENITPSSGGAEQESLEAYRERLRTVPESFSTAGPDGGYEFWAKTANPGIVDVKAWMPDLDLEDFAEFLSPWGITNAGEFYEALGNYYRESGTGPGNVNIACLMKNGELPSEEVKQQVFNILSDKTRRPLTDYVHIKNPETVVYNINLKYWIARENATQAASIINAIENENGIIQRFIQYQKSRLGLDIVPDLLHNMIMGAGVKRIEIIEPIFTVLKPIEIGIFSSNLTVSYEGLEDS
jgi:phage-related baseplate assembly protein